MDSRNVIFSHGHFYDRKTNERIVLRDGASFSIAGIDSDFLKADFVGKKNAAIRSAEQMQQVITADNRIVASKKMYNAGTSLFFNLHKSGRTHVFRLALLEDLYLVQKKKGDFQHLYECSCVVTENPGRTIPGYAFEPVYATSLNELIKITYVHYFGNSGNPARNVLITCYDNPADEKSLIDRHRDKVKK